MANYFVDSTTGDDGDSGLTMDLAWATLDYAATQDIGVGGIVWVRRIHSETPGTSIQPVGSGTQAGGYRHHIGWPRGSDATADNASWTNGSTTVDLVTTLSMDREKHVGRFVTGPDGYDYIIARITDANTFILDREYAGPSVTLTDGVFTIKADEDYDLAQAIDDSGWTIDVAAWTADADDLPLIDFGAGAYLYWISSKQRWYVANIHFKDGTNGASPYYITGYSEGHFCRGCIIDQSGGGKLLYNESNGMPTFHRCVFEGTGTCSGGVSSNGSKIVLRDCIINNSNTAAIIINNGYGVLENVNVGVEVTSGSYDISLGDTSKFYGYDVKFGGGTSGQFYQVSPERDSGVKVENYNKILGTHYSFNGQGTVIKTDVVDGSGDPYRRPGGGDSVIEILHNRFTTNQSLAAPDYHQNAPTIFEHEFEATTDSKSYRYYVQAEEIVAADKLIIECEYVAQYDDDSEYVIKRVLSTQTFTARADAEDWAEYMEVTGIQPAVASKVRIRCYCAFYHATGKIYIDPKVVITDG